jgi:hypothetical protein
MRFKGLDMPAIANEKTHGSVRAKQGSLNTMMLGGQTLEQLGELVNWTNASDFVSRDVNPWAALEDSNSPKSHSSSASSVSDAVPSAAPIAAPVDQVADDAPLSIVTVDPVDTDEQLLPENTDSDQPLDPVLQKEDAGEHVTEETELLVSDESDSETFPIEEREPAEEYASKTEVEPSLDQAPIVVSPPAVQRMVETRVSTEARSPNRLNPTPTSHRVPPRIDEMSPKPMMPTSASMSGDSNYLHRLEALVLELNLQLARVNGPTDSAADHTQWLSQRVIDLSLQNMALQEELAKRG